MPLLGTKQPKQLVFPKPPPVLSKADFTLRYSAGEFGNHSPTWERFNDYWFSNYFGPIHFRNRVAGGRTWYDLSRKVAWELIFELKKQNAPEYGNLYYSAMCPTHLTTIQGELMVDRFGHWQLFYSSIAKPMRDALREGGKQVGHLQAKALIERYMNPRSQSWLNWLLYAYPDHVVEFTCLSRCWGTMPGYDTLFWEIRNY